MKLNCAASSIDGEIVHQAVEDYGDGLLHITEARNRVMLDCAYHNITLTGEQILGDNDEKRLYDLSRLWVSNIK